MTKRPLPARRDAASIHVRLTPTDKQVIIDAAVDHGMRPGPWLRWLALRVASGRLTQRMRRRRVGAKPVPPREVTGFASEKSSKAKGE